jgi:hypothetical protein
VQKDFATNVRSVKRAARSLANDLKDFERRAGEEPKRCAEEAIRRIAYRLRESRQLFRELFNLDLEQRDDWWKKASLPTDPEQRRSFMWLTARYDLDKETWAFFEWCANRPAKPDERHARAMCQLYVDNQLFSPLAEALATDIVCRQLPQQTRPETPTEILTGVLVTHLSLHRNLRLRAAMDELRSSDESRYERLLKELPAAILAVWSHRVASWKMEEPSLELVNFKHMRNEVAKRLEQRNAPPQELDLVAIVDREKLIKQARAAGLSPQELEFYELFTTLGMKPKQVAAEKGVTPEHARQVKHRIKNKLLAAGL